MSDRNGKPLEWMTIAMFAKTAREREVMDLKLCDDEVAEVWKVESWLNMNLTADDLAADTDHEYGLIVSMDPSVTTAVGALSEAQVEDLETFFTHQVHQYTEATGSPASVETVKVNDYHQTSWSPQPVLLGTNPAVVLEAEAGAADSVDCIVRIWFTRKKAGRDDLARILLKRR